jgi:putative transposase
MDRQSARKLTKTKRQSQTCKVYEFKVDRSHLSQKSLDHLCSLFREAKWFYNYCLSLENINEADYTRKSVPVKVKDEFEERKFTVLKGQMKQSIKTRTFGSIKALSTLKKKGKKVGRLKFKSRVSSVPLVQLGTNKHSGTYYLDKKRSRVRIQGMKQWIRVRGLEQIKDGIDIANATLVSKCDDFYVQVTTFENKEERVIPEVSIGIDFGCQTQLTFSNGIKAEFQVPVSERLRRLDRKIDKKVDGKVGKNRPSNNRRKLQQKRRKEYERITNKKKDIRNKIVSVITKNYKYVCFQDESIHAWHAGNHGKKVQHSGIGGIISDLKHKSYTPVMIDKFFPSTQLCPQCGALNKLKVSDRIYKCECGFVEDRDIKSAQCIETEGLKKIPTDHREFKLEENSSSTFLNLLTSINGIKVSKKSSLSQEAAGLVLP